MKAATKRSFAVEMGVDPYSDWEPLQEALSSVGQAAFAGGITAKVAMGAATRDTDFAMPILALSLTALIVAYIPQAILLFQTHVSKDKAEQNVIAADAANQVANFVQEKFSSLELSANLVVPGDYSQEEQASALTHLLAEYPSFRSVVLLNVNGLEITHSTRLSEAEFNSLVQQVEAVQFAILGGETRYVSPVYKKDRSAE